MESFAVNNYYLKSLMVIKCYEHCNELSEQYQAAQLPISLQLHLRFSKPTDKEIRVKRSGHVAVFYRFYQNRNSSKYKIYRKF